MKVIIVGAGEVGFHIAGHLALENKDVVVIDKDADALRRVTEKLDVQVVHGSGSSPVILEEAGLKTTEILFTTSFLSISDIATLPRFTRPLSGLSNPPRRETSVVFPEPLLPMSAITSP